MNWPVERRVARLKAEAEKRVAFELAVQQTTDRSAAASAAFGPHRVAVPPESPRLVHVADETAGIVRPTGTPKLERPGLIPGIAGATALLMAVLPLEYALCGLIRWVVCTSAIWLVTVAARHKVYGWMCGYAIVAILWNPLLPFGFSRASWLMPDLIGAGMMAFGAYALVSRHPEPSEL